jgi:tol-pal system protein YbgF
MLIIQRVSLVALLGVILPTELIAQAEVRNANVSTQSPSLSAPPSELSAIYEMQALQQEVQMLRGIVEEQAYAMKRLKQQRLDDYLDLDKRVSELTRQQQELTEVTRTSTVATGSISAGISIVNPGVSTVMGSNSEAANTLYNQAINLLLDKQDYAGAQTRFTEYLDKYNGGQYTPNVYYWVGQIFFANGEKKAAADNFEWLISEYARHAKVPDAQFKLARIYFDQGKKKEAKEIFDKVVASNADAALLAKSFISKNY